MLQPAEEEVLEDAKRHGGISAGLRDMFCYRHVRDLRFRLGTAPTQQQSILGVLLGVIYNQILIIIQLLLRGGSTQGLGLRKEQGRLGRRNAYPDNLMMENEMEENMNNDVENGLVWVLGRQNIKSQQTISCRHCTFA